MKSNAGLWALAALGVGGFLLVATHPSASKASPSTPAAPPWWPAGVPFTATAPPGWPTGMAWPPNPNAPPPPGWALPGAPSTPAGSAPCVLDAGMPPSLQAQVNSVLAGPKLAPADADALIQLLQIGGFTSAVDCVKQRQAAP